MKYCLPVLLSTLSPSNVDVETSTLRYLQGISLGIVHAINDFLQ